MLIISEAQAHAVGMARTGNAKAFKVQWYVEPKSRLTMFCVEIKKTREIITRG